MVTETWLGPVSEEWHSGRFLNFPGGKQSHPWISTLNYLNGLEQWTESRKVAVIKGRHELTQLDSSVI